MSLGYLFYLFFKKNFTLTANKQLNAILDGAFTA